MYPPVVASELTYTIFSSLQIVGVIFKAKRNSFRTPNQNGQVRLMQSYQISMYRDSNRTIATDLEGHKLCINDNMKGIDDKVRIALPLVCVDVNRLILQGWKGISLHIHQMCFPFATLLRTVVYSLHALLQ
jgi:hypothetical protein